MKFNVKIELLKYVKRVAKELINEPSGVYGSPPVFRCYKFNLVKVLRELDLPFNQVVQRKKQKTTRSYTGIFYW
jgi:hypothetical protein